jgi:hypothetical protein
MAPLFFFKKGGAIALAIKRKETHNPYKGKGATLYSLKRVAPYLKKRVCPLIIFWGFLAPPSKANPCLNA